MTHEEIVELIREIVQEEKKTVGFFQKLREAATLVIPIVALLGILNFAFLKASVEPAIDAKLKAHSEEARIQMVDVGARFVTMAEFNAWTSEKTERWRQQDIFNARVEAALIEIQRDIKELLRRGK